MSRTLREAAQMALDALLIGYHRGTHDAITALREALNAPEPEPVARCILDNGDEMGSVEWLVRPRSIRLDHGSLLYAAPPAAPDHLRDIAEKVAPAAPLPDGLATNADEVICPNCAHQFRAIPENVQSLLLASGHEPPFTASPAAPVVPLPRPGPLGLIQYAGSDMQEYAAAVSAAKDAEIAQLRAELIKSLADNKALRERVRVLEAEVAGLREDAERYRWLRPRLFSADFDYNENGIVALVFEMPPSTQFWADCDMTVDAARKGEA